MNETKKLDLTTSELEALKNFKCKCGCTEAVKLAPDKFKCKKCGYRYISRYMPIVRSKLPGRNEPCTCGSGKKYKNCCIEL